VVVTGASTLGDKAVAFDLRANTGGATIHQIAVTTGSAPQIIGQTLFGSGNDTFAIDDGTVSGAAKFGAGDNSLALSGDAVMNGAVEFAAGNDTLSLAGTSLLNGDVNFGGGADVLTLGGTSAYRGQLTGTAGLAVNLGAGTSLTATNAGTVSLASLSAGDGSTLGVTIDSATNTGTLFDVAGAATFGAGTTIDVNLVSLGNVAGTYKVVQAGSLTGASNLVSSVESLPFIFDSSVDTGTANQVSVVIRQKSADELGINSSEAGILNALLEVADADQGIAGVFLGIDDSQSLQDALQQVLPDHSGGAFETATKGSRLLGRTLSDPRAPLVRSGTLGFWAQQVAWGGSKAIGATSSYNVSGWGAAAGVETGIGPLGNVGVTLSYLAGKDGKKRSDNELSSSQFEGGLYFRGGVGPIKAFARGTVGTLNFDGARFFTGTVNGEEIRRDASGEWKGRMYSGMAGVSYDARFGALSFRPTVSIEHYSLKEKGYTEAGGGDAFNLTVGSRKSSETAAVATLALGYDLVGGGRDSENFARLELEGGRRQILSGKLGTTTARFGDGTPFSLTPEERTSGFLGALRLIGGGAGFAITAEANAEQQQDKLSLGGRLGVQFAF
ncbi:MAG TPA: autotransporter domain-containing protein, partial [Sphingomicrobium sp.]|nr:autotransporter domain-containing protein [Sphingomicrobium sp.]